MYEYVTLNQRMIREISQSVKGLTRETNIRALMTLKKYRLKLTS